MRRVPPKERKPLNRRPVDREGNDRCPGHAHRQLDVRGIHDPLDLRAHRQAREGCDQEDERHAAVGLSRQEARTTSAAADAESTPPGRDPERGWLRGMPEDACRGLLAGAHQPLLGGLG